MQRLLPVLLLAAPLVIGGCAALDELRGIAPGMTGADDQLIFRDRLNEASPEELAEIGERLGAGEQRSRTPLSSLRFALWQATPDHPGHAPTEAEERLKQLLNDGRPPRELQALIRMELQQLGHLAARAELRAEIQRLATENRQQQSQIQGLEEQIQALTTLERRMGSGEGESDEQ